MTTHCSLTLTNDTHVDSLGFEILVDSELLYDEKILPGTHTVHFELPEDDGNYVLTFVLKGKEHTHTVIDADGNIVHDVLIKVSNVTVDGINIDQIMFNQADYCHNFNGTGTDTVESYLGVLGCNGRVVIPFSNPVYVWILENL